MSEPEKACVNCHFFSRSSRSPQTDVKEFVFTIDADEREAARNEDFKWAKSDENLQCYKGVWSEGVIAVRSDEERYREYVKRDRSGECFFWPHTEGMLMQAAEELQNREQDRAKFRERNWWVKWAAIAAVISVVINLLARLGFFAWIAGLLGSV